MALLLVFHLLAEELAASTRTCGEVESFTGEPG
jgi:hypothetical protein